MATIVFCEDDPVIQKLIRVALRSTDHEVLIAADGVEGLELIERTRPDLIFTDVAMPGMTGLELVAALRGRAELARIPIVLVSASSQRIHREEGYRHGVNDFLTKPFSPAELRAKIEALLSARDADPAPRPAEPPLSTDSAAGRRGGLESER